MVSVSIIIVNWNTKELIGNCIDSIAGGCMDIRYETIIVDNASSDGSVEFIKEKYPSIKLLSNTDNLGFATACNQAAEAADSKYIFLLNPDTVLSKGSVTNLVKFIENQSWAGMAGPMLLDGPGKVTNSVRKFPTMIQALIRDTVLNKLIPWVKITRLTQILPMDRPSIVDNVSGGALLIKKDLWKELGGMDERFFMFYEDVDLCKRVKEFGYNVYYLPDVQVIHLGGGSRHQDRSSAYYYSIKSRFLYFEKNYSKFSIFLFKCLYKPLFIIEVGLDLVSKLPGTLKFNVKKDFVKKYLKEFLFL